MTEQPMDPDGYDDASDVDVADQLDASDTLDQGPVSDPLDTGIVANDQPFGEGAFTIDQWNEVVPETIDDRIRQEVPDPNSAYGAPRDEAGLDDDDLLGGDDIDGIDAREDFVDDREVGTARAGRLVAPDEGDGPDVDSELLGFDVGVDGGAASAEEAAMHIVDGSDDDIVDDEGDDL